MATDNTEPEKLSHNHPLFLHSTDTSGIILISLQLTRPENYSMWSCAMQITILGRNKLGFIDGTCKRESFGPDLFDLWEKYNAIVLLWIMNCVPNKFDIGIVYSINAASVWEDLKERFDKIDCSRIFQIHKEIATINQGTSSISGYFSKLRLLWAEFDSLAPIPGCDCAKFCEFITFMESLKLLQFLMGLNESYEQARSQLLMMVPVPSINKAYSMLMERESQRNITNAVPLTKMGEATILMTVRGNGPVQRGKKNYNLYCDYCKLKGHTREGCYKLIGYPTDSKYKRNLTVTAAHSATMEEYKPHGIRVSNTRGNDKINTTENITGPYFTPEQYSQILKMLSKDNIAGTTLQKVQNGNGVANMACNVTAFLKNSEIKKWIVDTGATYHMVSDLSMLSTKIRSNDINKKRVQLLNGQTTTVTHTGSCRLTDKR
ncbi:uncharacterized protein LOC142177318 [Nicotiana tabacum]|uniref:Uncharacterized protein LOC142177318 n=1 Tax=Nicotiana tabacum TaxID=4097 RepID=A0AC58TXD9_TOBAC